MHNLSRRTFISASLAVPAVFGGPQALFAAPSVPSLEFLSNPLADFLHLLFFREEKKRFRPFVHDGFGLAPQLDHLIAVPEAVASGGLTRYEDVLPFVQREFAALPATRIGGARPKILSYSFDPPSLAAVESVIAAGARFYEPFLRYWTSEVQPQVVEQIAAWRKQDEKYRPLQKLMALHRLPLRSDRFQLAAMPFHPAGSANYSPAAVYTTLFRTPDLGHVLGHEASHLLWSEAVGTNWKAHPQADEAARLAQPFDVDVEEAVCLLMQTELSRACGVTEGGYRVSNDVTDPGLKAYLAALEADWPAYLREQERWPTLIDYALEHALATFRGRPLDAS